MFYPVPFDKIVAEVCKDAKLRRLVKNMIYDGVLSNLLNIDLGQMEHALKKQLGKKLKAVELNMAALEAGAAYSAAASHQARSLLDRADERDGGDDPRRGQCRRGLRLHDGRRDGLRLVSDHAVVVAARDAHSAT